MKSILGILVFFELVLSVIVAIMIFSWWYGVPDVSPAEEPVAYKFFAKIVSGAIGGLLFAGLALATVLIASRFEDDEETTENLYLKRRSDGKRGSELSDVRQPVSPLWGKPAPLRNRTIRHPESARDDVDAKRFPDRPPTAATESERTPGRNAPSPHPIE